MSGVGERVEQRAEDLVAEATPGQVTYLIRAIHDGHAELVGEGRGQRIRYVALNHTERFADPEERVRAEYWAELIYRYGYAPAAIGVEVTVPDRRPVDSADLVVFTDATRMTPFAVIECKRDGITDAEFEQAVEQAVGNASWAKFRASYVGVVAGLTRRFLDLSGRYGILEREANIIADLPEEYSDPGEWKYFKGGDSDLAPVSQSELVSALKKSHRTLWGGGRLSPPTAFGELCKLIFVKIQDERRSRRNREPYDFQIRAYESTERLAGRIRAMYAEAQARDPDVFTDTIAIEDATLRLIVSHLEGISLTATKIDVKGLAFETFMDSFFKGDFGQYFTPREVVNFLCEAVNPTAEESVLDPACGSGGFLLAALDLVRTRAIDFFPIDSAEYVLHWHRFAERHLFGIEVNEEITRVAKMNMILHDDGHTNVIAMDSLSPLDRISQHHKGFGKGKFDVVLTNPPFGSQVNLSEHPYLSQYELAKGGASGKTRRSQKSEVLFLERVYDFLKPGGRAGIVVPDGILSNASLQYVRDYIFDHFQVVAIISLPSYAFFQYGASVKSSLLIMRKRLRGEKASDMEEVFLAEPESIGYDATGRETDNSLPDLLVALRAHLSAVPGF